MSRIISTRKATFSYGCETDNPRVVEFKMRSPPRIANSRLAWFGSIVPLAILAVVGSVVVVSAGLWDAISHILQEPEFFWSIPHIVVYSGVSMNRRCRHIGWSHAGAPSDTRHSQDRHQTGDGKRRNPNDFGVCRFHIP